MRPSTEFSLLVVLLFAAGVACAQDSPGPTICNGNQTVEACDIAIEAKVNGDATAAESLVTGTLQKEAAKLNTGPSGAAIASGAATTNDYIPFIQALLGYSPGTEDAADNLGVEFSNFLPLPDTVQHKAAVQLLGSKLYDPLDQALLDGSLTTEREGLEKQVSANDDISITLSASPATEESGRAPGLHAGVFFELLKSSIPRRNEAQARKEFEALVVESGATLGDLERNGFSAVPESHRDRVIAAYERQQLASHVELGKIRDNLRAAGFYDALELLSNNAQWSFLANYRARDELAGPDEWTATVKYEIGWPSLTQARKRLNCAKGDDACIASGLSRFLTDPQTLKSRNASPRFTFNLTYAARSRYNYLLPETTFAFNQDSFSSIIGSIGYGMYLSGTPADTNRIRMDFTATYEDVSDDPSKNDRGVANLSFSYPIGGGTFLSIGAIYATKPEYRGLVDEELSARAGLLYKFAGSGT